ncbi:capsular polysaccharide transport system permease protein [Albimonas donghaensis]|uniref:Capsular polysaccharide transport system permease protein n=1 Tax=Albimonas donghaensis TaxID=356660 RepID=A0A1H2WT63_9RHOB|nr:hypothetical protein [Albimonas donghaensis]SDW83761.1 capsular polysaccharide transport system permease protein [Albimonas donghaensis]
MDRNESNPQAGAGAGGGGNDAQDAEELSPEEEAARQAKRRERRLARREAAAEAEAEESSGGGGGAVARRGANARPKAGSNAGGGSGGGGSGGGGGGGRKRSVVVDVQSDQIVARARRRRFWGQVRLWLSFIILVAAPATLAGWYLNVVAADQYASQVSFAVRSLDSTLPSPVTELFGGASDSTAGDSQMLFEYLQSQPLVELIGERVDLDEVYNRPEADWLFSLGHDRTVEERVAYWNRAATVSYDTSSGIIYVEVRAFRPGDAKALAEAALAESELLINGLSTGARQDAIRFAQVDLVEAEARIRTARVALQAFRSGQGTADISGDITQQMQLIGQLRGRRAEAQAEYDSRKGLLGRDSPTLSALRRRVESLDAQIAEAEARISTLPEAQGAGSGERLPGLARDTLAEAAGAQEELQVELELATQMYVAAQSSLEAARADARRAQRYLATHIQPTLSEEPEYPLRITWTLAIFVTLLLAWSILQLIVGSIRDRS